MTQTTEQQSQWQIPFFSIWTGQQFSLIGSMLAQFALVWWLTKTTGSATVLATATLVALLPDVLLGPFAGALVDRWNRRKVMIFADAFIAFVSAWLAYLFWSGTMQVWHIYAIMLLRSVGGIFHWPAMTASTSLMVPEKHLSRVAGLNQTVRGALNIAAPPLGAMLLGILPLHGIMAIDVVTAIIAVTPLFFVQVPEPERRAAAAGATSSQASLWADVREGLHYIWSWPGLLALLIMASLLNFLFNPAFSLMPILVTKHFGGEAMQLGWMESGWGIGVVAGGLTLSVWGGFRKRMTTSLMGLIGMGLGTLLIGLTPATAFPMALAGVLIAGFMNPIANGPVIAIFQAAAAPEVQGRVFMTISSVVAGMSPLGMAIAGPVADALGVQAWFLMGGAFCTLMGVGCFFVPAIMHLEENGASGKQEQVKGTSTEPQPALDIASE